MLNKFPRASQRWSSVRTCMYRCNYNLYYYNFIRLLLFIEQFIQFINSVTYWQMQCFLIIARHVREIRRDSENSLVVSLGVCWVVY